MFEQLKTFPGLPSPLGFSIQGDRSNFALFSSHSDQITLVLFNGIETKEIALQKTKDIWHIAIQGLPLGTEYAFRAEGPYERQKGLLYKKEALLADPYSKAPATSSIWGKEAISRRCKCIESAPFDWQGTASPQIPKENLVVYEMHVRGFTKHSSSSVSHPGTFAAIIEKIPYLKKLGVNAIELMPIFEFDETRGAKQMNYWGYSPLYFFAPMRRFASSDPILEFKTLVRELHKNQMELWLDVVYNHTGEAKDLNHYVHFRGIDNPVYYMVDKGGNYLDFTGCFNTFNVNQPTVQQLILDSLRYWAAEMRVDGFRFDLASIFNRGCDGAILQQSPILKAISKDPLFKQVKLIAEPWDAAGLYQPGTFAKLGGWSEWNGPFRDRVRQFIKGTDGLAGEFAKVICGSQFLYSSTSPLSSVNFITVHDGFSLRDLVSYQSKRNFDNGEMNQDGSDKNDNWNCGAEGITTDPLILALRERQMRNFFLALFFSQGIPLLKMGDEYGHSSLGNNNPYVQDNEISWFLWDELEKQKPIFDFVSALISFRKKQRVFQYPHFLTDREIEWHGFHPLQPDWGTQSRFVAFTLKEANLYVAFNADYRSSTLYLPTNQIWKEIVNTKNSWQEHQFNHPEKGKPISSIELIPYSAFVAKGYSRKENTLI